MHDNDKKLLELAEKATPRPWKAELADIDDEDDDGNPIQYGAAMVTPIFTVDCGEYYGLSNAEASYIVAAANAVPKLLERIRLLRRHVSYQRYADLSAVRAAQECLAADDAEAAKMVLP